MMRPWLRSCARAARYVHVMFPPAVLVPVGLVQFFSVYLALEALAGLTPLPISGRALLGAGATMLWALLIRIDDDLTDTAHDARMAAVGDPRYRARPTVTGAITQRELRGLQAGVLGLFIGLNLAWGGWGMRLASMTGYGLTWLGFRWFFLGAIRRNPPPLAFLARKLLTALFGLYALGVYVDEIGHGISWWTAPLVLAPCAGVAAWESARKIRVPEDETEYWTYSRALGWRTAAWLPVACVVLSAGCLLPLAKAVDLGGWYPPVLIAAGAAVVAAVLRFRMRPTAAHARLGGVARLYGIVAHGGFAVGLVVRYGTAGV